MIDYTNRASLYKFGMEILNLPIDAKARLTAFVVSNGLMLPKDFAAKFLWWLAAVLYGDIMIKSGGDLAVLTIQQTVDWMINGRDNSDSRSAGGFNAREIEMIEEFVSGLRR